VKFAGAVGSSTLVVPNVVREYQTQVPLTEDSVRAASSALIVRANRSVKQLLTAIHGAEDGAIDGARVAAASVGIVAARSSTCRQPAEHPCGPQTGGRAVLPRRFRSSALRACGASRLAIGLESPCGTRPTTSSR